MLIILLITSFYALNSQTNSLMNEVHEKILAGDYENITSIIVSKKGEIIFEKYYNGADSTTLHNTRSATKTLASILMGLAIKDGFIESEKEPIMKYLKNKRTPIYPDARKILITIEDLLTMSSILECDDNDDISRGQEEKMYIIEDWTQFYLDLPIRGYPEWETKPEEMPYGRSWHYCTAGATALAEVIQNAIGEPLHEYAKRKLFKPLGFGEYKLSFTPTGILCTAGGNHIRSRDFLKLAHLYLKGGKIGNKEIVSKNWVEKSTTPKAATFDDMEYGYLFWLYNAGNDSGKYAAFVMSGNGGNKVVGIPALDVAIVITSTNYNNPKMHQYSHDIIDNYLVPYLSKK